jgi:hypothetical protein
MAASEWFVLKSADKEVFGPTSLETLRGWASEAKISPLDKLSSDDKQSWVRAPMVAELQMDWLIEMSDNYLYGPTNVGTIQEFMATGEIDGTVMVINCLEGTECRLSDAPFYQFSPHQVRGAENSFVGTQWPDAARSEGGDAQLRQRTNLLEKQVMELQRTVDQWEQDYESLKQQFIETAGREPV